MRVSGAAAEDRVMMGGSRDAESLFRGKPIAEIRQIEAQTRKQIEDNKEELRQLVGNRYRDLIDSANSIVLMKSSCRSISSNISSIHHSILSLSEDHSNTSKSDHQHTTSGSGNRFKIYGVACRVKYLVDTPENIWGCLDESMFLEASARYVRANHVHHTLNLFDGNTTTTFPLLQHQWQIVESFKSQISQKSRERLFSDPSLSVYAYADALAAVAVIDELRPAQVLALLLDSRKSWILQALSSANLDSAVISVLCQVMSIIQVSVGQVGELFLHVLSDMPLFYKVILESPPASQLYGGIPNPDDEIRLWKTFRNHLESSMVVLDKNYISKACSSWLRECRQEVVDKIHGRYLIDAIRTGRDLELAEKSIRESINSKQVLEGSLDWLKTVFGSEIELPWSRIRELMLEEDSDLWDEIFEDAFVQRMKAIIDSGFEELSRSINVGEVVSNIGKGAAFGEQVDFQVYLSRPSTGGGVWFIEPVGKKAGSISSHKSLLSSEESDFRACLNSYLGPDVCQIRDAVDKCCQTILEDLMHFLESPNAAQRLKTLAPYIQAKCYETLSAILTALKIQLDNLYSAIENKDKENEGIILAPPIIVERALFIGRLLFAIQNHSKHIPILLGSPRFWINETVAAVFDRLPSLLRQSRAPTDSPLPETPGRQTSIGSRKQTSFASAVLLGANESACPKLEELSTIMGDLCIRSHSLWISWLSDELSVIFSRDLGQDEGLSSTTSLRGWEEVAVKQEQPDGSPSEMKILLPSMPSLYVISFLFRACEEIHRIGGHVLDRTILKKFALRLLEKVIDNYRDCISAREANGSNVSGKGILQVLLDLRFASDVLSGGDFSVSEELPKSPEGKYSFRRKQESKTKSVIKKRVEGLIESLSQRLDPIDWLTYEPYLWENERQSYLRHAVLFGFFIQLNRLYTDTVQKLSTNSESNIMRCSTVPRFQYLPISAPALSTRGVNKTSVPSSPNDLSSRNPWKDYTNGELSRKINLDENSSFGVATPFLKSFMQVGSRFGESTLKLGSILTDGQVGIFKDRSASAMSTFGDILPVQAAGLLSSFTTTKSDS